jgi:hypothetical protein
MSRIEWWDRIKYSWIPYDEATHILVRVDSSEEMTDVATAKCELDAWRIRKAILSIPVYKNTKLVVMPLFENLKSNESN